MSDVDIEGTDAARQAFKEKLKSLQFSSVVRSTKERSLDRVIDMPREKYYAEKAKLQGG